MTALRFIMTDITCSKCKKKIRNGQLLGREEDNEKCYCFNCDCRRIVASPDKREPNYKAYYASKGVAHFVISTPEDISELKDGVHALIYDPRTMNFSYGKGIHANESVESFVHTALEEEFILEKNERFTCLFFADRYNWNAKNFFDEEGAYGPFVSRFIYWTNHFDSDVCLLIDEFEEVVGILTDYEMFGESKVVTEYFEGELSAKDITDFVEEYGISADDTEEADEDDAKEADEGETENKKENDTVTTLADILNILTPQKMLEYCEDRICGQGIQLKKAVYLVDSYLQSVADGNPFQADNWILTSPSGTGKTEFYRAIRDIFKMYNIQIPVVQIDLSQITEAGYKGLNSNTIIDRIAAANPAMGGVAICFLDEADKKFIPSYDYHGIDNNAAVQSNLLTMLEGANLTAYVNHKDVPIDTSKTMFVLLGSFQKLRDEKQKKSMAKGRIGFGDDYDGRSGKAVAEDAMYADLELEDMIEYGMQEEIAGRITYVVNFHKLSDDDMRDLIRKKTLEISEALKVKILMTDEAVEDFLKVSFGNLGVRTPMNQIKKLVQEEIAEVFFESGFDSRKQMIVIDSFDRAHVERISVSARNASGKNKEAEL